MVGPSVRLTEYSPLRRGGRGGESLKLKSLRALCLCGESWFSKLVAALPRYVPAVNTPSQETQKRTLS
jgi:hypothetical protein